MNDINLKQNLDFQFSGPYAELSSKYLSYLLNGDRHHASKLIIDAVSNGANIKDIYLHVFQSCQIEIGRLWQKNKITVAQEHFCTATTQLIMSQLYPFFINDEPKNRQVLAVCVGGELHEIGMRMVADFFEMDGWDTYYIGANTPVDTIIETIQSKDIDLIAISVTIGYNLPMVIDLINAIRSHDRNHNFKIMVGGRPFNISPDLWKKVGADGYASDAEKAVIIAKNMLNKI